MHVKEKHYEKGSEDFEQVHEATDVFTRRFWRSGVHAYRGIYILIIHISIEF